MELNKKFAEYFMTYNRVHERGSKGVTKNYTRKHLAKRRMGKIYI